MNAFYRIACFLGIYLPLPLLHCVARRAAELKYFLFPAIRRRMQEQLRCVLEYRAKKNGTVMNDAVLASTLKDAYYNFARYMVDFFRIPKWDVEYVKKNVKLDNLEYLDEALSYNKGVISITAHLGNWELAGIVSSLLGYKISAVSIPYINEFITGVYKNRRKSKGVNVILTGSGPKQLLKALKRNDVIAILGDRIFTEKGMTLQFMGKPTKMPRGPATLAVKTGAKMLPGFFVMENGGYRFFFGKIFTVAGDLSEEEKISSFAQQGAKAIEDAIIQYPSQWLNFE